MKRTRPQHEGAEGDGEESFCVPRDVTARIQRALSTPSTDNGSNGQACFVMMSWNVDGLDEHGGPADLIRRILGVAECIATAQPVAVMLQEVIPPHLELLSAPQILGAHYDLICAENPAMPYYCVTLLHKRRVKVASTSTTHFSSSRMGRHVLDVNIVVDNLENYPLTLLNTHLESTKNEKAERQRQLSEALASLAKATSSATLAPTAILAGDLNIRDDEMAAAKNQAKLKNIRVGEVRDAWVSCGSPKDHEYTWDTSVNTNLGVRYKSRCRFDRVLHLAGTGTSSWVPSVFQLIGRSKLESLGRFPSDHWGIQITWAVKTSCGAGVHAYLVPRSSNQSQASAADEGASMSSQLGQRAKQLAAAEKRQAEFLVKQQQSMEELRRQQMATVLRAPDTKSARVTKGNHVTAPSASISTEASTAVALSHGGNRIVIDLD